jgi:hypothetical protein
MSNHEDLLPGVTPLPRRFQPEVREFRSPAPPWDSPLDPPDVDGIGRLSGEAVMKSYEAAAASLAIMGDEVKKRIAALVASLETADNSMKLLDEAAKDIVEQGKLAQAQVEAMTALSADIRATCAEFKKKFSNE